MCDATQTCAVAEATQDSPSGRGMAVQITKRIPMKPRRKADLQRLVFHDVESQVIASMKSMFDIDMLRGVSDDLPFLKKMMHRRHVFEHNAGVADARYIRER